MIIIKTIEEFAQTAMIELKRLCDEIFRVTKYCLNLEIEILDIYPFITFFEAL